MNIFIIFLIMINISIKDHESMSQLLSIKLSFSSLSSPLWFSYKYNPRVSYNLKFDKYWYAIWLTYWIELTHRKKSLEVPMCILTAPSGSSLYTCRIRQHTLWMVTALNSERWMIFIQFSQAGITNL